MRGPIWICCLLIACLWMLASSVSAGVELRQLRDRESIAGVAQAEKLGVAPGAVLLGNDLVRVLVVTSDRADKGQRTGDCYLLAGDGAPVRFTPGPAGIWKKAEIGKTKTTAVLKFKAEDPSWSADLVYQVHESNPWIEVTTSVRNANTKQTLEIPIVDDLRPAAGAAVSQANPSALLASEKNGPAAAVLALSPSVRTRKGGSDTWSMGHVSGDAAPSTFKRVSSRLTWSKNPDLRPFRPIPASREWTRDLRDEDDWHRIQPNAERVVKRRLVAGASSEEVQALVDLARVDKLAIVQQAPSPTPTVVGKPKSPAASEPAKKIVGRLRGQTTSAAAKTADPPKTGLKVTPLEPPAEKPSTTIEPEPAALPPISIPGADPKNDSAVPVPSLPKIEDLPPPE